MLKGLFRKIDQLLRGRPLDRESLEELEELLIAADVSIQTTAKLLQQLQEQAGRAGLDGDRAREILKGQMLALLAAHQGRLAMPDGQPGPLVYLLVGVNGVGKTTCLAKLAWRLRQRGKRVLLAAADTFRAAASEQLQVWGQRVGAETIRHQPGGDPAAVVFDALRAAQARGVEGLLIDTAGRLHTKRNLVEEMMKIARVVEREQGRPADETLLVLDATTGQNALAQARVFSSAIPISGVVLTKLDGSARGGTLLTLADQVGLPIKLIGVGEGLEDLADFDAAQYVESLFE